MSHPGISTMSTVEDGRDPLPVQPRRRHQRWILVTMLGLRVVLAIPYVVIGSFYPQEVERWKSTGEANLYTGIVVGAFSLPAIIASLVTSQWMLKDIGCRLLLCLSLFLSGTSSVLFGFLHYVDTWEYFFALSVVIRLLQGVAYGSADVIAYGLGTAASSEQVGLASGLLELSFGAGTAIGPAIGGALYKSWGFTIPLAVVGGIVLMYMMVVACVLSSSDTVSSSRVSLATVANFWTLSSAVCGGLLTNTCYFFLVSTLAAFLDDKFHVSTATIGLFFLLSSGWYAMSSPSFGMLAERVGPRCVLLLGTFVMWAGLMIVALTDTIPLQLCGQVVVGVGMGASFSSVFPDLSREADIAGQPSSEERNSTLSSIIFFCYTVGALIGSSVGGALASRLGFRMATLIVSNTLGIAALLYGLVSWAKRRR